MEEGGAGEPEPCMAAIRDGWIDGPEDGGGGGWYGVEMYSRVEGPVGAAEIVAPE
jgi:hypothetical protein